MKEEKVILILGAGVMQVPAITIAKDMGWKVIVADGNPEAEGRKPADHFENVDLKDLDGLVAMAEKYRDLYGLDGVFTAGTDFSTSVSYIAEALHLPGVPYETALKATDKVKMRQAFREHGVASPAFACLTAGSDLSRILETLSFPLVVKPVDNMGARGVRRVDSENGLRKAFESALELSRSGRVIAEQYIDGPELSIDAVVYGGQITLCGIADRHIYFEPYFVELGHTMPTSLPGDTVRRAADVFMAGVKALGIDMGAAKGDIKIAGNGPVIGEIAARLSGGYMSGWTFPYSSGVEVTRAALKIAVGLPPGDLTPLYKRTSCERAFISIPGIVKEVKGFDSVTEKVGVKASFLRVDPGSTVVFPTNNVEKCGNIITCADTREEAEKMAEKAIGAVTVVLKGDCRETEEFIFGNGAYTAFQLDLPENRDAFKKMPAYHVPESESLPASLSKIKRISIFPLPCIDKEQNHNWHGHTLHDEWDRFVLLGGVSAYSGNSNDIVVGSIFWKAFLKGGLQAGLYLIDVLKCDIKEGKDVKNRLEKWEKSAAL
ncbi:MAG: ATP-grasp domain-containing protein [Spirochaetales bacterium]|nr:ATP-grasp domain-containing protein [Spirochaetales bacterium]